MKLKVKKLPIGTGDIVVVVLCEQDASRLDLKPMDRVVVKHRRKKVVATVDIACRNDGHAQRYQRHLLHCGEIGLFAEASGTLGVKSGNHVTIETALKPVSLHYIKKKMDGEKLRADEIHAIVKDIVKGRLSAVEMTYFVGATYHYPLSIEEVTALTNAMVDTGDVLKLKSKVVLDKHCIGGVAANRTSMVVVPILAALGLMIPKTSSRSITSAAGTADTVEVLCPVTFSLSQMRKIVHKTNGCLVWGGAMSLAPADDKIIQVEHPLSIDPTGQLLASILAKKKSVSATHVLIDIPVGKGAKITKRSAATKLKKQFEKLGKRLGMKVQAIITDGSQPIGNGIGPALEARDVLWTLQNHENGSALLREKSLRMAGLLLEMANKAKKGKGYAKAKKVLDSGKAYAKFAEIIKAQGGRMRSPEKIRLAHKSLVIRARKAGKIVHIDNKAMNKVSHLAGCPHDQEAGVYLYCHKGDRVKKGDKLFTIYSDSAERLKYAVNVARKLQGIVIK